MTLNKTLALLLTVPLVACADMAHSPEQVPSDPAITNETIKPGADVKIRTTLREPLRPGDSGALEVDISEAYPHGTMNVAVSTSEGLELFTTATSTSFDMETGRDHNWTVYFEALTSGTHYVNISVSVDSPLGKLVRTSAATIIVNGRSDAPPQTAASQDIETMSDGTRIKVMEAVETDTPKTLSTPE